MDRSIAKGHSVVMALILIAGLIAYANSFSVPFQFDDDSYIVNNPALRSLRLFVHPGDVTALSERSPDAMPTALRYAFTSRIMGHLSFALNYQVHGLSVAGYHVVNLLIHLACALLVYFIGSETLGIPRFGASALQAGALRRLAAAAPALLFVSHPIQTQAVTYLTQRFTSLSACFFLLSLLLYIKARTNASGFRYSPLYAGSLCAAVAAMLTKEFTITLPVIVALYDLYFLTGTARDRMKALAPFTLTLAIIPVLVFLQQGTFDSLDSTMRTMTAADATGISRTDYLLTQFRVVMLYLRLLFFPAGQNVDHDVAMHHSLSDLPVLASLAGLLLLFACGVFLMIAGRKENRSELGLAGFGIVWFFITLSVESSVIPLGELVAEYRLYLPSVGMITAVVSLASFFGLRYSRMTSRPVLVPSLLLALCVSVFCAASIMRNSVWASETSLWEDAAAKSPGRTRPHQNLALFYSAKGRLGDARRELQKALLLEPDNFELHNNLGVVYKNMGAYDQAVREYEAVLRLAPDDVMAHYNLGNLYLARDRIPDALREYQATVRLIPDYDEAHNNLGIALLRSGKQAQAVREFSRAVELNPGNRHAHSNLDSCRGPATGPSRNSGD